VVNKDLVGMICGGWKAKGLCKFVRAMQEGLQRLKCQFGAQFDVVLAVTCILTGDPPWILTPLVSITTSSRLPMAHSD